MLCATNRPSTSSIAATSIHPFIHSFIHSNKTSSRAVAERPRDASCLSVVSFNSTIHRAQSSVISGFRFRFTASLIQLNSVFLKLNEILFSSLRLVVHAGCDKQRFTDASQSVR